jgi:4'-phosphopantetheinyl transferase
MPLIKLDIDHTGYKFCLWKITETENELIKDLNLNFIHLKKLSERKSTYHRKSFLAIRQLLKKLNIELSIQNYDRNGRPYLEDGRYISFSHTKDFAAVVVSEKSIGVDIEKQQNKIIKIAPRFLSDLEKKIKLTTDQISKITQIWTAKEAVYKAFRTKGIDFSKQIKISTFLVGAEQGSAETQFKDKITKYRLFFYYLKDHCITVALSL